MKFLAAILWLAFLSNSALLADTSKVRSQNPSPMIEHTRKHERILAKELAGLKLAIQTVLPKPVEVFIPQKSQQSDSFDVLVHFLGANYIVQTAAAEYEGNLVCAMVNLGAGSKVFNDAFIDTNTFARLIDSISVATSTALQRKISFRRVFLSGFSAGYGAIRRIMSSAQNYARVDAVLLLDGIHAGYVPDGKVLAEGGIVDSSDLELYLKLAKDASRVESRKQFLITHSEIFPGTYVSTTEATDYLLAKLGMTRTPVLAWGPLGMQQLSEAKKDHFAILGFAGNTAPDHVDHLHALSYFLRILSQL
ncbi:MAG: hypothetical protein HYY49_01210 [Ignavibacteriales bacterium]|nr:hypothetical protein [Ignavibacteriales bacterium]